MNKQCYRGFSFLELLVAMVVLAVLAGLFTGLVSNAPDKSKASTAISLCRALDAAKQSYRLRVPTADADWAGLSDPVERYARLRDPNNDGELDDSFLPMSPAEPSLYLPAGYSFVLGNLWEKCGLTGPKGPINY